MSSKEEIVASLKAMAVRYNEAIDAGKVRAIRPIAAEAHKAVFAAIGELEATNGADAETEKAHALLMDVRWGRRTQQFVEQ